MRTGNKGWWCDDGPLFFSFSPFFSAGRGVIAFGGRCSVPDRDSINFSHSFFLFPVIPRKPIRVQDMQCELHSVGVRACIIAGGE
jgi:hypothetical protein